MNNVVQLKPQPSVAQRLWNLAPTPMRTRSSRTETEKACKAVRGEIGAGELLSAFETYLAEDADVRRWRAGSNPAGPPALHRWVAQRRFEAWSHVTGTVTDHAPPSRIGSEGPDNPIRTALVQALGEGFVRSYIDPFEMRDGVLIVPEGKLTARAKLLENRDRLREAGLVSMRAKP